MWSPPFPLPKSLPLKRSPACGACPTPVTCQTTAFTCVFRCFPCDPSCGSASWATPEFTQRSVAPMVKMTRSKTFQAYLPSCHRTYSCIHCRAHLANHDELISKVCAWPHLQVLGGCLLPRERKGAFAQAAGHLLWKCLVLTGTAVFAWQMGSQPKGSICELLFLFQVFLKIAVGTGFKIQACGVLTGGLSLLMILPPSSHFQL